MNDDGKPRAWGWSLGRHSSLPPAPPAPPAPPPPPPPEVSRAVAQPMRGVEVLGDGDPDPTPTFEDVIRRGNLGAHQARAFSRGEPPLVTTALVGARVWRLGPTGRLISQFDGQPWVDGENVATCARKSYVTARDARHFSAELAERNATLVTNRTGGRTWQFSDPCAGPREEPECPHGFYAYTGAAELGKFSQNTGSDTVAGLIEGYGIVRCGTGGFISEKAKVLAIILPQPWSETSDLGPLDGLAGILVRHALQLTYSAPVASSWDELFDWHPELLDRLVETQFTLSQG